MQDNNPDLMGLLTVTEILQDKQEKLGMMGGG